MKTRSIVIIVLVAVISRAHGTAGNNLCIACVNLQQIHENLFSQNGENEPARVLGRSKFTFALITYRLALIEHFCFSSNKELERVCFVNVDWNTRPEHPGVRPLVFP